LGPLEKLRALPRLAEVTRTFLAFGLQDIVHSVGVHRALDEASGILGWKVEPAILAKPLPERLRLALESLGPTFMKLGQVLASRVDLLPREWIASLDQLHANATPLSFEALEAQLLADLACPVDQAFASFERTPRAAASIAQVHRATLPAGVAVAVKIRRPGIAPVIESDLVLLETLAQWLQESDSEIARWQPIELARQLRRSILRELDFATEARGQQRLAGIFRDNPDVVVPAVHAGFTRPTLLVMDWVEGIPGTDLAAVDRAGLDRKVLAARGADAVLHMVLVEGFFHADPHPGNVFYLPGNRLALIDFGMVGWLSNARRDELLDMLAAIASRDLPGLRDVLLGWAHGARVNTALFTEDLGRLLFLYQGAKLGEVRLGTLLGEIAAILRDHRLVLPPDLALLFKALITLEGLGAQLDPDFRLVNHVTPHVSRLLRERWQPQRAGRQFARELREAGRALAELPRLVGRLARQTSEEGVGLRLEVGQLHELASNLERSVNRLAIGMVTAALIVGSSILLAVTSSKESTGVWLLGLVGIAIAFVNSVWLIASIRRSRRRLD
jgi:ubiquinone biosynthesis protein